MKSRPILMSTPMVRAILEGRKTQTRRIVKPQFDDDAKISIGEIGTSLGVAYVGNSRSGGLVTRVPCPYGQPGDRLWVREAWRIGAWNEDEGQVAVDYKAGPVVKSPWIDVPDDGARSIETFEHYWIQSTDDAIAAGMPIDENGIYHWQAGESPCRWRPSIHMPRWASRITLEITEIRVERVQDISVSDAIVEGYDGGNKSPVDPSINWYSDLWESLNGSGSWDLNPWVWVVEFKRAQP